jgi:hypothetical protein
MFKDHLTRLALPLRYFILRGILSDSLFLNTLELYGTKIQPLLRWGLSCSVTWKDGFVSSCSMDDGGSFWLILTKAGLWVKRCVAVKGYPCMVVVI